MIDKDALAWERMGGMLPAVVQDAASGEVRMLGYMNRAALEATIADGFVTFFSRSKDRLWRKGESSGNTLAMVAITADCDGEESRWHHAGQEEDDRGTGQQCEGNGPRQRILQGTTLGRCTGRALGARRHWRCHARKREQRGPGRKARRHEARRQHVALT